jgi:hypothetical protein
MLLTDYHSKFLFTIHENDPITILAMNLTVLTIVRKPEEKTINLYKIKHVWYCTNDSNLDAIIYFLKTLPFFATFQNAKFTVNNSALTNNLGQYFVEAWCPCCGLGLNYNRPCDAYRCLAPGHTFLFTPRSLLSIWLGSELQKFHISMRIIYNSAG